MASTYPAASSRATVHPRMVPPGIIPVDRHREARVERSAPGGNPQPIRTATDTTGTGWLANRKVRTKVLLVVGVLGAVTLIATAVAAVRLAEADLTMYRADTNDRARADQPPSPAPLRNCPR